MVVMIEPSVHVPDFARWCVVSNAAVVASHARGILLLAAQPPQ
jgi:hypothetical protein